MAAPSLVIAHSRLSSLCRLCPLPHLQTAVLFQTAVLLVMTLIAGGVTRSAVAQQEPVAVFAASGIDRLLDDVDYLFDSAEHPEYAEFIHGFLSNLNDLKGLDHQRPFGAYFYFSAAGEGEPQPLLFFPVSDVEQLLKTIKLGPSLQLERGDADDRLILTTEDGKLPLRLAHGYAFLDPSPNGSRLEQTLHDPQLLIADLVEHHDAALLIRREGIPPFLFEAAIGQMQAEIAKGIKQQEHESDAEYAIRRQFTEQIQAVVEASIRDWQSATVGLRLSEEDHIAEFDVHITFKEGGKATKLLANIAGHSTRFASLLAEPTAFSAAMNGQPTAEGRDLLKLLVSTFRKQVEQETAEADAELQAAIEGVLQALEASTQEGQVDAFLQLAGSPPNAFILLTGIAIEESDKVATGLSQLLPYAEESQDIREIEMAIARAGDTAIHRLWPESLRKQDRRLYGDEAAIYLAVGNGAIWLAIGDESVIDVLSDAILTTSQDAKEGIAAPILARPRDIPQRITKARRRASTGSAFLNLTLHATDWVGFARTDGGGKNAKIARLARQAFNTPDADRAQLTLSPTADGLHLNLSLEHGYVRLVGLALSASLANGE